MPRDEKILVALSGGADSTALLLALRNREYSCIGAHINHNTRGGESDGDETFVRELCAKLEVPFVATKLNLPPDANEAVMREARDIALSMPRLIMPSIQVNMRAGHLPEPEDNGIRYLKIPVNAV